ncbi:IS701 family transposase [Streptomyces sp. NPDC048603]|uniref:IS701 family transposase n=1 Tax=Streptomyces sp. NPDC048603 TaxID=3365577 RepID=UPI0037156064
MGSSRLMEVTQPPRRETGAGAGTGAGTRDAVADLCAAVFESLPRADQRRKAELYVRGLLTAPGRKSMRSIAAHAGMAAGEQSLHHFISCSPWNWQSVREALALELERTLGLQAWVVKPMVIPKSGAHTVGVDRRYDARLGQMVNGQQAFGAWAAGIEVGAPAGWSLHLPEESTLADCAAASVLDITEALPLRRLPVVLDAVEGGPETLPRRFAAARMPFLMRIGAGTPVTVTDPHLPGTGRVQVRAGAVMETARMLRRPVRYADGADGSARTVFLASVQVATVPPGRGGRPLRLLAEWADPRRRPDRFWLTDMVEVPPAGLLRLAELSRRVDREFAGISDRVGMRDFEGRSFQGWHRHITLASAAHAVRALERVRGTGADSGPGPAVDRRTGRVAGGRAADGFAPAGFPAAGFPPAGAHPSAGFPLAGYPGAGHVGAGFPAPARPAAGYRPAGRAAARAADEAARPTTRTTGGTPAYGARRRSA